MSSSKETLNQVHGKAPARVCASCAFQYMEHMQGQIMQQMVCHRFPPSVSMVPTPQGIQGITMSPVVQPHTFCHEWRPKDPISLMDSPGSENPGTFDRPDNSA